MAGLRQSRRARQPKQQDGKGAGSQGNHCFADHCFPPHRSARLGRNGAWQSKRSNDQYSRFLSSEVRPVVGPEERLGPERQQASFLLDREAIDLDDRIFVGPSSEEPTSDIQSLLRNSYAVFWLK